MINDTNSTPLPFSYRLQVVFRQIMAICYDSLLVVALIIISAAMTLVIQQNLSPSSLKEHTLSPRLVHGLTVGCIVTFYAYFWLKNGQTLGMRAWRLRLTSTRDSKLSMNQVLVRLLTASVSAACFGLGFLWPLVDNKGRRWHDIASKTHITLEPVLND